MPKKFTLYWSADKLLSDGVPLKAKTHQEAVVEAPSVAHGEKWGEYLIHEYDSDGHGHKITTSQSLRHSIAHEPATTARKINGKGAKKSHHPQSAVIKLHTAGNTSEGYVIYRPLDKMYYVTEPGNSGWQSRKPRIFGVGRWESVQGASEAATRKGVMLRDHKDSKGRP